MTSRIKASFARKFVIYSKQFILGIPIKLWYGQLNELRLKCTTGKFWFFIPYIMLLAIAKKSQHVFCVYFRIMMGLLLIRVYKFEVDKYNNLR